MALDLVELITETKQELPEWLSVLAKEVQMEQRCSSGSRKYSSGKKYVFHLSHCSWYFFHVNACCVLNCELVDLSLMTLVLILKLSTFFW